MYLMDTEPEAEHRPPSIPVREDDSFRELLDHLAVLLANEYLAEVEAANSDLSVEDQGAEPERLAA
jgi:hypothetical protein